MRPRFIVSLLGAALSAGVSVAQTPAVSSAPAADPTSQAAPALPSLPQTMVLAVQGQVTWANVPVDLSLAVSGQDFSVSTSLGNAQGPESQVWVNFSGTIEWRDEKYLVTYKLNWRIPVTTQYNRDDMQTVTYRSLALENSVYLRVGVPLTLLDEQGKKLTLVLKKPQPKLPVVTPPAA